MTETDRPIRQGGTLSLASVLAEPAQRTPENTAVIEGDHRFGYRQLWEQTRRYATALRQRGITRGDRVALLAPNVTDFVRAYYAVQALGAVVVPIPVLLVAEEAAYLVENSRAVAVIGHTSLADLARGCAHKAGVPMLSVGPETAEAGDEWSLTNAAAGSEPIPAFVTTGAEDPAVIFYTSGTTGRPKGAVLTHLNMVMNATVNAFDANDTSPRDRVLGCLPLFHVFGQTVSMNTTFRAGATLVLQPRFDPSAALELMRDHRITQFNGVPTMYVRMLECVPQELELPELRLCISGGAALPVPVLERFNARFDTRILEGYGLSETSPTATVNQPSRGVRAGTVGHPLWGIDVEIADAAVEERIELLDTDQDGEVVVRGHNVFAGYLDDPEATAVALVDGWFRTGDIGRKDADGFLSIVDRKKDLIIRNGYNVYPREVEELLLGHPSVAQVAVVGVPDATHGEEVWAAVVAEPDDARDGEKLEAEIVAWCAERTAGHKYPRRVTFVDELPLGPSHKVLKRELRARMVRDARA